MNSNSLISIIIPVYNAEKTLYRIIGCLKKQTFQNFEVIFVDDGSTDQSYNLCKTLSEKNFQYHVYSQQNQGAYAARNEGLKHANGDYITFIDADDQIDSAYLETLLNACQQADIAVCDVSVWKDGHQIRRFSHSPDVLDSHRAVEALLMRQKINSGPYAKLFHRNILKNISFPSLQAYEDILFILEVFDKSSQIVTVNSVAYYYIQNNDSIMSTFQKIPSIDIVRATDVLMRYIINHPELSPECCYTTISHLFQYAFPLAKARNYKKCMFLIESKKLYRKYILHILSCSAIPWKEKLVFSFFSLGLAITKQGLKKIK